MKLSHIALAIATVCPFVAANAGITITPLVGYNFQDTKHNNTNKLFTGTAAEPVTNIVELQDDLIYGGSIGVELTPWLGFEVEYTEIEGDIESAVAKVAEYKKKQLAGNFYATSDLFTQNYDSRIKPYLLLGAGHVKYRSDDGVFKEESTIGNAGLGVFWRLNDALSLRTEARATHNFDNSFWDYTALAGLNVVFGGHLKPVTAEVPVVVVPQEEPVVVVPEPEQPKELVEPINLEVRVYFDVNKSNIKPQYTSEVAKVAEVLNEYPTASATIAGHTDNTGPRALNERLSVARANAVKSALISQYNVDAARLSAEGFAWDKPVADNSTKDGRAMNRRVEATIHGERKVMVPAN